MHTPERPRSAPPSPATPTRRQLLAGSAGLAAGMALSDSQPNAARASTDGQTFTLAANWSPTDIDPQSGFDPGSTLVMGGIYEGLLRQVPGEGTRLEAVLAERWESNADASSWTFYLRPGVTFQDGSPLTAEAARASFVRQMQLKRAPAMVLNRFFSSPDQIVALDELTLRFDLGRPWPIFDVAMAAPSGAAIINVASALAHEVDGDLGHDWCQSNAEGLGTGPYRLAEFDPHATIVLERHDGYWRGWAGDHFDQVVIRVVMEADTRRQLIEQGTVDLVENIGFDSIEDLMQQPEVVVDRHGSMIVRYLGITAIAPFDDPRTRQALCWAFPYQEVLDGVYRGYARPAQGAVSTYTAGFAADTPAFTTDLARAKALLDEAGVPDGTKIWTVGYAGNPLIQPIAELLQHNLSQIGIQLDIVSMDYATFIATAFGDLPVEERPTLFPSFWAPDYDDAWNQLWPLVSCNAWNAGNGGHYCNPEVDALLVAANDATDPDAYAAALARAQRIVAWEDPAAIYFALPEWITVLRHDIGGFQVHPLAETYLDYYALHRTP